MKQYYKIVVESDLMWRDTEKIIVNSKQELNQYIKRDIDWMRRTFPKRQELKENGIVRLNKKIHISDMYQDDKRIGYTFSLEYRPTEEKMEELEDYGNQPFITYWCERIKKSELMQYAGFKEIE